MNQRDREVVWRMSAALNAVPGVANPASVQGMVRFYYDISEVRVYLRQILAALRDGDPAYAEENQHQIAESLRDLEAFVARRKAEQWGKPTQPYRFIHTA